MGICPSTSHVFATRITAAFCVGEREVGAARKGDAKKRKPRNLGKERHVWKRPLLFLAFVGGCRQKTGFLKEGERGLSSPGSQEKQSRRRPRCLRLPSEHTCVSIYICTL